MALTLSWSTRVVLSEFLLFGLEKDFSARRARSTAAMALRAESRCRQAVACSPSKPLRQEGKDENTSGMRTVSELCTYPRHAGATVRRHGCCGKSSDRNSVGGI